MSDRKVLGELTIKDFDELIEGYIEHGGPDAVSFAAFGEVLADLEAGSAQETIELTGIVRGDAIFIETPRFWNILPSYSRLQCLEPACGVSRPG